MKRKRNFSACPKCGLPFKATKLIKCKRCGILGCDECVHDRLCMECFIIRHDKAEVRNYFNEKYSVIA